MMTALLALGLAACGSDDEQSEGSQTITFGVTPWTSTTPPTKIASLILQDMGYKVEETNADVSSVFVGLSRGDVDVFMDTWMPVHDVYMEKYADQVEDLAVSYSDAASGLTVPAYLEGINSIEDIKGNEDLFEDEMYGIEPGASVTETLNESIDAYGLDMTQVNSSEGGMMAQVMRKMEQKEAVVFYGWRPHTMFNQLDLKILEDPQELFDIPSIHVISRKDLKDDAPEAYEFLSNWSIPLEDVEEMIVQIEDGKDEEEVAQEWIENNQDKVDEMLGK